jgi:hypothetical protein
MKNIRLAIKLFILSYNGKEKLTQKIIAENIGRCRHSIVNHWDSELNELKKQYNKKLKNESRTQISTSNNA